MLELNRRLHRVHHTGKLGEQVSPVESTIRPRCSLIRSEMICFLLPKGCSCQTQTEGGKPLLDTLAWGRGGLSE